MNKKKYGVWYGSSDDLDVGYWELYDSIRDAVTSAEIGEVVEVYELTPKLIGKYSFRESKTVYKVKK